MAKLYVEAILNRTKGGATIVQIKIFLIYSKFFLGIPAFPRWKTDANEHDTALLVSTFLAAVDILKENSNNLLLFQI